MLVVGAFATLMLVDSYAILKQHNPAYGLDYTQAPVQYDKSRLVEDASMENYVSDKAQTLAMLENWKSHYQAQYGEHEKPRAVFVMASGGGLRSAYWTFQVMQHLDHEVQRMVTALLHQQFVKFSQRRDKAARVARSIQGFQPVNLAS